MNLDIQNKRAIFEDEQNSLIVSIYPEENFYIDEFEILSFKPQIDMTKDKKNKKVKFENTLDCLLEEQVDFIFYEISYIKQNNSIIILNKFDSSNAKETLENLKICHNSSFILINKNNNKINTDLVDNKIGFNFEPINVLLLYGTEEKNVKVYSNLNIQQFKEFVKSYLKINFDINLTFKTNNKNIELDKVGFDKKNQIWLTLKQLKFCDKSLIFITKSDTHNEINVVTEEKINTIVKLEGEEDFTLVKIKLSQTFGDLLNKIAKKLNLFELEDNNPIQFRVRKEINGHLIYKSAMSTQLLKDEMFVEGGVRLRVEFGETYEQAEILLKIILESNGTKQTKEFIGSPEKILISDLKKFICDQFNLKFEEHTFYKVSALGDPIKAIKNENQTILKTGLKDCDTIFLKNMSAEINEIYHLKVLLQIPSNDREDYVFKPLDDHNPILELSLHKDTPLRVIKENLNEVLGLGLSDLHMLRVRNVSKKLDPDRILRQDESTLKKLNLDNPATILFEVLDKPEVLRDNQIQLYVWDRNQTTRSYLNKRSVIFEFENNIASSDQLYEFLRKESKLNNISISKYAKFNYVWEYIPEINENGPINLRKVFNLRDGDWIGIRDDTKGDNDDFQTLGDKEALNIIKTSKLESAKAKKSSKYTEKPLRIPKFN